MPEAVFHGQAVKTVAYLRVSTAQQDVGSQRLAILEYARKHDFRSRRSHLRRGLRRDRAGAFGSIMNCGIRLRIAAALSNDWGPLLLFSKDSKRIWRKFLPLRSSGQLFR